MTIIQEQIEIDASRADVFRFCHDISSWSDWNEQVVRAELLSPAPLRTGSLLRIDGDTGGAVFSWDAEYLSYQMPTGSKLRVLDAASSSPFRAGSVLNWELESTGRGTRFTWIWDYRSQGFLASLADKLGRRAATQRAIQRSLENLKQSIESGRRGRIT